MEVCEPKKPITEIKEILKEAIIDFKNDIEKINFKLKISSFFIYSYFTTLRKRKQ